MDFTAAYIDNGPSPAGNLGPYLKVPTTEEDPGWRTVHRVYARFQPGERVFGSKTVKSVKWEKRGRVFRGLLEIVWYVGYEWEEET